MKKTRLERISWVRRGWTGADSAGLGCQELVLLGWNRHSLATTHLVGTDLTGLGSAGLGPGGLSRTGLELVRPGLTLLRWAELSENGLVWGGLCWVAPG